MYLDTPFLLTLRTVDDIVSKIVSLGKGSHIYKVDISRAFRHLKICPRDYKLLGVKHKGYYYDSCLCFGFRQGTNFFQRLSDSVRFMMRKCNFSVINYVDDICGFNTPSTSLDSFKTLKKLLTDLGLDISNKKIVEPSTKVICLGILFDTEEFSISVPPEKLAKIIDMCSLWKEKYYCSKQELQSLLGSLLYISNVSSLHVSFYVECCTLYVVIMLKIA